MRDSGVWPMPNFHLLPKEYHIYYVDYFDSDGNFRFDRIQNEYFGNLIEIPESFISNKDTFSLNEGIGEIRNIDEFKNTANDFLLNDNMSSDVKIEGNIFTQTTDVQVQAAIAINKNLPKFCEQIKDDSINLLKISRPHAIKKLSKRQLQNIKKHIVKKRKLCNETCKKWNEMTLDEQEAYLEEHAFSIHSSISSRASSASSSTRTGLSSQSSTSSRNISLPQSPRMASPVECRQDTTSTILNSTKKDDNMMPVFDDPVLNNLLNDSLAAAITESKEIVNKSKNENNKISNDNSNRLNLPTNEPTFGETIYMSNINDDIRPDLALFQNQDTTPNNDLFSLDNNKLRIKFLLLTCYKMTQERYTSVPVPIHRSASHTPSMLVNAKKYLSDRPQLLDCPRCRCHGETELTFKIGLFTWVCFFIILIAGVLILPLFFVWVPFSIETFKDVEHHCASCKAYIGTYRRLGKST
ncbi:LPS-induced tumor necrosis factor alpha factor domain-containing protein [Strongyloides ratti]|uniref:LPS-induced tumor necrosis factor alpha factor domain-containing protein n=1 Tax=Strongyloides ratti TaxID=34506 RepID=A0A090LEH8_STRRB|nr:LPS-induced tumor necrosis factor alpha factor domain-containing protein [Strongyloides ratti]CEF68171.1 LPS-induced tumor necrosis factor alpha factor domain-containing protein [Strongyloides ratti]